MDRRDFLKAASAGAAALFLPALGCGGTPGRGEPQLSIGAGDRFFYSASELSLELRPWAHRVLVRDAAGGKTVFGGLGAGPGQLNAPAALAIGPDGLIYVSDRGNHRIQVFDVVGRPVRSFGAYGTGPGQLSYPTALAFHDGALLVADTLNHRVQVFSPEGTVLGQFGDRGGPQASVQGPRALAIGPDGTIHVADAGNFRVQVYDAGGTHLRSYGGATDGGPALVRLQALAIDAGGFAWVGDAASPSLLVFEPAGAFSGRRPLYREGRPAAPVHLALGAGDVLHVSTVFAA